jgi:abortive infection bacteriophage resistance protein
MKYTKSALDIEQQIIQLQNRGLIINDEQVAKTSLKNISYYRLAG